MRVKARTVEPEGDGTLAGVKLDLDGGDKTPACDVNTAAAVRRPGLAVLHARDRPAARHGLDDARLRRADQQEQEQLVAGLRLRLLLVDDRRQPAGHQHGRLPPAAHEHAGDAHDRRLPPAQRRAVPRRHRLGLAVRVRRPGQPPALLRAQRQARRDRRAVLRRRGPQPRRRRPAHARRRDRRAGDDGARRRRQLVHVDGQEHRLHRPGAALRAGRWTTRTRTWARTSTG